MTTTATEAAFLDDIIAHPDDDTLRLIYSDWLQDHGEGERAEFIRAQVEYAALDTAGHTSDPWENHPRKDCPRRHEAYGCGPCSRMVTVSYRMRRLFARLADGWFSDVISMFGDPLLSCTRLDPADEANNSALVAVRRGFIAEVRCPLAAWLQHGPEIAAQHPITCVRLTDREPDTTEGVVRWWASYDPHQTPDCLPAWWFDGDANDGTLRFPVRFPTPEAAYAWASARAILWARGKLLSKEQPCVECGGTGRESGRFWYDCDRCKGTGKVVKS